MTKNKISQAFTQGLLAGYVGQSKFTKTTRGSFEITSSHYETENIIYHDEWTNGGGQEIVKVGNEMFTRVYAGHTFTDNQDTIKKLISYIQQLDDKTRLFSDCKFVDGDRQYQYKILDTESDIISAKETIKFHNQTVFIHYIVLSPIV